MVSSFQYFLNSLDFFEFLDDLQLKLQFDDSFLNCYFFLLSMEQRRYTIAGWSAAAFFANDVLIS